MICKLDSNSMGENKPQWTQGDSDLNYECTVWIDDNINSLVIGTSAPGRESMGNISRRKHNLKLQGAIFWMLLNHCFCESKGLRLVELQKSADESLAAEQMKGLVQGPHPAAVWEPPERVELLG